MSKPTFYFDRCIGNRFPKVLESAKPPFDVEYHHKRNSQIPDKFPQNMSDDDWLSIVGERSWVVFSHDSHFHTDPAAVLAIKQHKVACFYIPGGTLNTWEKLVCFGRAFRQIREQIKSRRGPYIFRIDQNCRFRELALPRD